MGEKKASYQKKVFLSKAEKTAAGEMFRKYDSDGSGLIDMTEIEALLKDLGIQLSSANMKANIDQIMKAGDRDSDGNLSEKEFFKFYRKCLATEDKKASYKAKV